MGDAHRTSLGLEAKLDRTLLGNWCRHFGTVPHMTGDKTRCTVRRTVNIRNRNNVVDRRSLEKDQADQNDSNPYSLVEEVNHKAEIQDEFLVYGLLNTIVHIHLCSGRDNPMQGGWRDSELGENAVKRYLAMKKVDRVRRSLGQGN